jgi:hypothetical protein
MLEVQLFIIIECISRSDFEASKWWKKKKFWWWAIVYFKMILTNCDFNLFDQEDKSLWEWIITKIITKLSVSLMKTHQKFTVKFTSNHSSSEKFNSIRCEFSNRKLTSIHIISTSNDVQSVSNRIMIQRAKYQWTRKNVLIVKTIIRFNHFNAKSE